MWEEGVFGGLGFDCIVHLPRVCLQRGGLAESDFGGEEVRPHGSCHGRSGQADGLSQLGHCEWGGLGQSLLCPVLRVVLLGLGHRGWGVGGL